MSTQLGRIAKKAKLDRTVRFTSLAHLLTPSFLKETWRMMNRHAASGIDGQSTEQFANEIEQRVEEICQQLKAGTYRAPPVRRVEIPKGRARAGRGRWESQPSRTGCCSARLRAFWKLCLRRTSSIAVSAFAQGATPITLYRSCACIS
jgi:hypothetical protein